MPNQDKVEWDGDKWVIPGTGVSTNDKDLAERLANGLTTTDEVKTQEGKR